MDLFNPSTSIDLLPKDGEVIYYGPIMNSNLAVKYFNLLMDNIQWENDQAMMFGKLIITKRKVAWYGSEQFPYTYSNVTKTALPWTKELLELKELVEKRSEETFNSCLLNLYHSGEEGMAWHSDGEKDLKKYGAIASMSFGADRKFAFKHKETKETVSQVLEKGSLLVMKGKTQENWLHRLPPTKKVKSPRINLTFRTIVKNS
jgi:alkylated DNA repair dioxygenase AlkB